MNESHAQARRAVAAPGRRRAAWLALPAAALAAMLALVAMLALAVCTACGQGGGATAGPPGTTGGVAGAGTGAVPLPDASELLAPADVQAVSREVSGSLSSTLEDAVGRDPSQCSYSLGGTPPRVISLTLRRAPSAEQAASQQRAAESGLRSLAAGAPVEEVRRLGDDAFWVGGQIDQLHVRRGDVLLIFTVQIDKEPLRAARTLAGRALGRLAGPRPARPATAPGGGSPAPGGAPARDGGGPR
jgi:hypothetical protein